MFNKKEYMNQYRIKHKEEIKKSRRLYYIKNHEKTLEYDKKYREDNPEIIKERSKKYREKNRELLREKRRIYRENNHEKIKKYEENDYERRKKYNKKYRKTENGKAIAQRGNVKRQTRERKIINTLTSQEWLDILEKYNYRCAYCGIEFDCENLPTKDHIIPISKGGDNTKENVVPACQSCNSKKGISKMSDYENKCQEFIGL